MKNYRDLKTLTSELNLPYSELKNTNHWEKALAPLHSKLVRIDFNLDGSHNRYLFIPEDYKALTLLFKNKPIYKVGDLTKNDMPTRHHIVDISHLETGILTLIGEVRYVEFSIRKPRDVSVIGYGDYILNISYSLFRVPIFILSALIGFILYFHYKREEKLFLCLGVAGVGFTMWILFRQHDSIRFKLPFENMWVTFDMLSLFLGSAGVAAYVGVVLKRYKFYRHTNQIILCHTLVTLPFLFVLSMVQERPIEEYMWVTQVLILIKSLYVFSGVLTLGYLWATKPENIGTLEKTITVGFLGLVAMVQYGFAVESGILERPRVDIHALAIDFFVLSIFVASILHLLKIEKTRNNKLRSLNSELDFKVKERTEELSLEKKVVEDKNRIIETMFKLNSKHGSSRNLSERLDLMCQEVSHLFDERPIAIVVETKRSHIVSYFSHYGLSEERRQKLLDCHYRVIDAASLKNLATQSLVNYDPIFESDSDAKRQLFGEHVTVFTEQLFRLSDPLTSKASKLKIFIYGDKLDRDRLVLTSYLASTIGHSISSVISSEKDRLDAFIDDKTGFRNKKAWEQMVTEVNQQQLRYNQKYAILFGDVTGLKTLNDTYGHDCGDAAIVHACTTLASAIRSTDIAFKYAGDEIAVYMPNTNLEEAEEVKSRIKEALANKKLLFNGHEDITHTVDVVLSMGCASLEEFQIDKMEEDPTLVGMEEVAKLADKKMYEDKKAYYATKGEEPRSKRKDAS